MSCMGQVVLCSHKLVLDDTVNLIHTKVLTNMGTMVQSSGMLYKEVVQAVLLYRSNSWVMTGVTLKLLEGFHFRSDCRIAGMTVQRVEGGEWEYPPVADALEAAGLWQIKEYIHR